MLRELVPLAYAWHSIGRWVLLALALIAIVRCGWVWTRNGTHGGLDRVALAGFAGAMTVQGMLGLAVLVGFGMLGAGFPLTSIIHSIVNCIAIVVSFQFVRWNDAPSVTQARNGLLSVSGALACAVIGMLLLPEGLARMMNV
jgi:hypothetical protein